MLPHSIHSFHQIRHQTQSTEKKAEVSTPSEKPSADKTDVSIPPEQPAADKTDEIFAKSYPTLTAIGTEYAKSYITKFSDEGSQYVTEEIAKNVFGDSAYTSSSEGTAASQSPPSATTPSDVKEPKAGLRLAKKAVSGTVGGVVGEVLSPSTTKAEQRKLIANELSQNINSQHADMQDYIETQMKKQPERVEQLNTIIDKIKTRYAEERTAGDKVIRQAKKEEVKDMADAITNAIVEGIVKQREGTYKTWAEQVDAQKADVAQKTKEQLETKKERLESNLEKRTTAAKDYIESAKQDESAQQPSRGEKIGIKGAMVAALGVTEEMGTILIQRVVNNFVPPGGLAGVASVGTAVVATTLASAVETQFTPFTNPVRVDKENVKIEEDKKLALATRVANNVFPLVILTALSPLELTFFATLGVGIVTSAAANYLNPVDQSNSEVQALARQSLAKGYTKEMFEKFSQADEMIWNRIISQIALAAIESIEDSNIKATLLKEFSYLKDIPPEAKTEEKIEDDKLMAQLLYIGCGIILALMIAYRNSEKAKGATATVERDPPETSPGKSAYTPSEKAEINTLNLLEDPIASKALTDMTEKQIVSRKAEAHQKISRPEAKKIATQSVKQAMGFVKAAILEQCNEKVRSLVKELPRFDAKNPQELKMVLKKIGEHQKQIRAMKAEYLAKYPMLENEMTQIFDWGLKKLGGDKTIVISLYKMGHLDSDTLMKQSSADKGQKVSKEDTFYKNFQENEALRKDMDRMTKKLMKNRPKLLRDQVQNVKLEKTTRAVSSKLKKTKAPLELKKQSKVRQIQKASRPKTRAPKITTRLLKF